MVLFYYLIYKSIILLHFIIILNLFSLGVALSLLKEDDLRNGLKITNEDDIQIILQVFY